MKNIYSSSLLFFKKCIQILIYTCNIRQLRNHKNAIYMNFSQTKFVRQTPYIDSLWFCKLFDTTYATDRGYQKMRNDNFKQLKNDQHHLLVVEVS